MPVPEAHQAFRTLARLWNRHLLTRLATAGLLALILLSATSPRPTQYTSAEDADAAATPLALAPTGWGVVAVPRDDDSALPLRAGDHLDVFVGGRRCCEAIVTGSTRNDTWIAVERSNLGEVSAALATSTLTYALVPFTP